MLVVAVLLRVAIVTAVVYLLLPQGALCPHCNVEMVGVRNLVLDRLVPVLERRWCLECGWNGVVRRGRRTGAPARRAAAPRPAPPPPPPPAPLRDRHPLAVRGGPAP